MADFNPTVPVLRRWLRVELFLAHSRLQAKYSAPPPLHMQNHKPNHINETTVGNPLTGKQVKTTNGTK